MLDVANSEEQKFQLEQNGAEAWHDFVRTNLLPTYAHKSDWTIEHWEDAGDHQHLQVELPGQPPPPPSVESCI